MGLIREYVTILSITFITLVVCNYFIPHAGEAEKLWRATHSTFSSHKRDQEFKMFHFMNKVATLCNIERDFVKTHDQCYNLLKKTIEFGYGLDWDSVYKNSCHYKCFKKDSEEDTSKYCGPIYVGPRNINWYFPLPTNWEWPPQEL